MQTGGLWKELQTARSGLPATIRVPRTASLDTRSNLHQPTDRPTTPFPSRILARLNAPAFPKRVSSPFPPSFPIPLAPAVATQLLHGFAVYTISGILIFVPARALSLRVLSLNRMKTK